MKRLLAIYAHPDDEGAAGGTLARYAQAGVEVALICATRGEVGEISDPGLATRETLGAVRTAELEGSCAELGIKELHFLDYRDSGMVGTPENEDPRSLVQAPETEAVGRIVRLMRQLRPDVVVTFEPFGWYGHPDHIATYRLTTAAYEVVGSSTAYPEAGAPWQPEKLFYTVLPFGRFQKMIEYAREHGLIEGDGGFGDRFPVEQQRATEAQVTHVLDVGAQYPNRQAAMKHHRTQFSGDSFFSKIPDEIMREMSRYECFIQVQPPPAAEWRAQPKDDLFA